MQHKEELKAFRICLLAILSGLKLSMSDISLAVRTFFILPCPSSVPRMLPIPFFSYLLFQTRFYLSVKGTSCHNFLQVLHLLPSLGSHCCRFVLCYSTSASPSQSFCCVQQIAFCDCYPCEPCKMMLLGNCAVSWEMAESGCHVFTALGGTQEPLHCSQCSQYSRVCYPRHRFCRKADGVLRVLWCAECV